MKSMVSMVLAAGLACTAGADTPPISAVTPKSATMIVEVPDAARLIEAARASSLYELAMHPRVRSLLQGQVTGDEAPDFEAIMDRLGIDPESLAWPVGQVGMSLFYAEDVDRALNDDPDAFFESGRDHGFLFLADFGDHADGFEGAINTFIDFAAEHDLLVIDAADDDDEVLTVRSRARERLLARYEELEGEFRRRYEAVPDGDWEAQRAVYEWYREQTADLEPTGDDVVDDLARLLVKVEALAFAREGDAFVVARETEHASRALEALRGGLEESAAAESFYTDGMHRLPEGAHVRILLNDALTLKIEAAEREYYRRQWQGEDPFYNPFDIFRSELLGIANSRGSAFGVTLDPEGSLLDLSIHMMIPEKVGFLALSDVEATPYQPPNFLPTDAVAAGRMQLNFPALPGILRKMADLAPEDQRQQAQSQMAMASAILTPIAAAMGGDVHIVVIEPPAPPEPAPAPDDEFMFRPQPVAMPFILGANLKDDKPLIDALNSFGAAAGFKARQLDGAQVFDYENEFFPFSIGIGHGFAFVGAKERIEDALRAASRPGDGGLAADPDFQHALTAVDMRSNAIAYLNAERAIEWIYKSIESSREDMGDDAPAWMSELPEKDLWLEYFGDVILEQSSVEDGFDGRVRLLPSRE